jgi:IclR family acetate operon transcriptional repressor
LDKITTTSPKRETARRIEAVERAVAVLDAVAAADGEVGTNELARRTGINASSVSRLLATLADSGLVELVQATGRYRLGVRLVQLGNAVLARLDVRELGRPRLEELARTIGETATLSVAGDGEAITVDFVRSPASVQSVAQVGRPSVGHATAVGKVVLAFAGRPLPEGPLRAYTGRTIVDSGALGQEVSRVRDRGWAQAVGEREDDLNAIAAPVRAAGGELAAVIGVQGPAARFTPAAMRSARDPLVAAAGEVSAALGWLA